MKRILIIEGDFIVRGIYRRKFEVSGYKVESADDGPVALKLIPEFKPHLIQIDIALRSMSGIDVIRQIRSMPGFGKVPILVLSNFYRPDMAKEAWDAGATKCVSKMDCTPNLALDIVEEIFNSIPDAPDPTQELPPLPPPLPASAPLALAPHSPPPTLASSAPLQMSSHSSSPSSHHPTLGPSTPIPMPTLTLPTFATQQFHRAPSPAPSTPTFGAPPVASSPSQTRPSPVQGFEENKDGDSGAMPVAGAPTSVFRLEIRQEFLKRVPQIQADLRDRVGALIKSKSTTDQLSLLHELNASVSSLAGLAGITGFTRIAHLAGALETLIKDLHKKPQQMTSSVLRTITHASDCLNTLFRELSDMPQETPQSSLILAVDDEPISRRTISVALSKASLRCISLEDPKMALKILGENQFDLIFLDAEMPEMNGFELCAELRSLPTNKATPVIFVTSLTNFEIRAQSSLSGGNDLIAKPFLMMELAVKALTYLLKTKPAIADKTGRAR